ncbi:polymerase [Trametes polyzona]|nr:polymerase [Trametes polyzona]
MSSVNGYGRACVRRGREIGSCNVGRYLGVTPPISTNESNAREKEVTTTLMEELHRQGIFESEEEAKTREIVLGRLAALIKKFVRQVSLARGLSEAAANAAGGKIYTFGSYRLGVHGPGTDIDTLCVVPRHVTREDFFTVLEGMLREMEGVTNVSSVPEAYVPIITMEISGIPIDLLFAQLALPSIPDDLELQDDNILRNMDDKSIRSVNGSRVINEILRLVPNVDVFRDALRCIKLWAQKRAIYSNVNGFLGGVAWAMLVARVCQLYPNAVAGAIVSRFFVIMHKWSWPQPVLLKAIEDGPLQVRVWNPKLYPQDRAHRMPIITPAYPSMCATHNVMQSTQQIMKEEFQRGCTIVDEVMLGKAEWSALFVKHDFFQRYRFYLQVVASSRDRDIQNKWSGTVESKIRQLVMRLEYVDALKLAHPFTKGFEMVYNCLSEEEAQAVSRGEIPDAVAQRKQEDVAGKEGVISVHTTSFFIGLSIKPKEAGSTGPRRLDISYPTAEFIKMVKMWEKFDESAMHITVRHIKHTVLPDYVFEPGEREAAARPKKRTRGIKDSPAPAAKRSRTEAGNQSRTASSASPSRPSTSTPQVLQTASADPRTNPSMLNDLPHAAASSQSPDPLTVAASA